MTQKQRVLRSLQASGVRGVTQADWTGCYRQTPDGGPPILRLPARIMELRQDGVLIVNGPTRDSCRVYHLEPIRSELFPKPPSSPYDYGVTA